MNSNIWFKIFDHICFTDYKSCILSIPEFRQYLNIPEVIWRILYYKIWKIEDDIGIDEIFWYKQIPNLKLDLKPFHTYLQKRFQKIFSLKDCGDNLDFKNDIVISSHRIQLFDHPLSYKLFIPTSRKKYKLNTKILTSVAKCFIVFMHMEKLCSFNDFCTLDMWDLLRKSVMNSKDLFSKNMLESKVKFPKI